MRRTTRCFKVQHYALGLVLLFLGRMSVTWVPTAPVDMYIDHQTQDVKITTAPDSSVNVDGTFLRNHFNSYTLKELEPIAKRWTMVTADHFTFATKAVARVNEKGIVGDVVECGVWKGGMSMAMILINQRYNADRHFWLFDTFEGLPPPESKFDDPKAKQIFDEIQSGNKTQNVQRGEAKRTIESGKWNYGPLDVVKNNIYYTGYPKDKIHFVQGKVEDTLKSTIALPKKIAILRLDTDWYDSTMVEMEVLWNRLQPGGVLIVDDFCSWSGAAMAVRHFFNNTLGLDADKINEARGSDPCLVYWKALLAGR